jgi:hypothetical protein
LQVCSSTTFISLVCYLQGIENILPHIQSSIGVPKSQYNKLAVDADDALDVDLRLFDVVGVQGAVAVVTYLAVPKGKLVVSTDNKRVREGHLVVVWQA